MRPHEQIGNKTEDMERAIHAALDACDAYIETIRSLVAAEEASADPRVPLLKRYTQFISKAENMISTIEDDVLTDLNFCLDRLFSIKMAEDGEFI